MIPMTATMQSRISSVTSSYLPSSQVQKLAKAFLTASNTDRQIPPLRRQLRPNTVMQRFQEMKPEQRQNFLNILNKVASGAPAPVKPRIQRQENANELLKKITPPPNRTNQSIAPGVIPPPPPMPQTEPNISQGPRQWKEVIATDRQDILAERDSRRVMIKPHIPPGMNNLMEELTARLRQRDNISA